ncbi:response regulator [bacterium]|nr:response regulator [bacterium]
MIAKPTISIIDDEAIIRKSLEIILIKNGYSVVTAKSGEDLLEAFRCSAAQLYIIDLELPGINGIELALHIVTQQPDAKIIFLTGGFFEESDPRFRPQNLVGSFCKPVEIASLLTAIQTALNSSTGPEQPFVV